MAVIRKRNDAAGLSRRLRRRLEVAVQLRWSECERGNRVTPRPSMAIRYAQSGRAELIDGIGFVRCN